MLTKRGWLSKKKNRSRTPSKEIQDYLFHHSRDVSWEYFGEKKQFQAKFLPERVVCSSLGVSMNCQSSLAI